MHNCPLKKLLCTVAAAIGLSAILTAGASNPLKVGFVASFPIPEVIRDINALIDQGVDVVFQHTDSPAPIQAAERRGVYAVGYASDMAYFGPKAVLTSIVNKWAPLYIQAAQGVIDHDWKFRDYWDASKEGTAELASMNDYVEDMKAEIPK